MIQPNLFAVDGRIILSAYPCHSWAYYQFLHEKKYVECDNELLSFQRQIMHWHALLLLCHCKVIIAVSFVAKIDTQNANALHHYRHIAAMPAQNNTTIIQANRRPQIIVAAYDL